jgi:hypothetical protein
MVDWAKRIDGMSRDQVRALRENAIRLGNADVLELCNATLSTRSATRARTKGVCSAKNNSSVAGFHFVCPQETGVTHNSDGTVWTGTWVVDALRAERGARMGAYVALHTAKSEPSYLQGTIKDWRRSPRERQYAEGRPAKTPFGIDFLLELTGSPYEWQGHGSGEKGYAYAEPPDSLDKGSARNCMIRNERD